MMTHSIIFIMKVFHVIKYDSWSIKSKIMTQNIYVQLTSVDLLGQRLLLKLQGHRVKVNESLASKYSNVENSSKCVESTIKISNCGVRKIFHNAHWINTEIDINASDYCKKAKKVKMGCIPRDKFRCKKISVICLLVLNLFLYAGNYSEIFEFCTMKVIFWSTL